METGFQCTVKACTVSMQALLCIALMRLLCFRDACSAAGLTVSGLFAGQANYGYANGAVDTLAQCRKMHGLPALAIQWGPIADVGFVAEIMKVSNCRLHKRTQQNPS